MPSPEFALLSRALLKQGFDCSLFRPSFVLRRVESRMKRLGLRSLRLYSKYLDDHPEELSPLREALAIHVTSFFRDPRAFRQFQKLLSSHVLSRKKDSLRIWSVGCSSGQEAFSIAMTVAAALDAWPSARPFRVVVLGTDVDEEALARARAGEYSRKEVEGVPPEFLEQFFQLNEGLCRIKSNLRKWVRFARHNVVEDKGFPGQDVIFCRNVLIYLSPEAQVRLVRNCARSLVPKGYLVLGGSEGVVRGAASLFRPIDLPGRIYQKI